MTSKLFNYIGDSDGIIPYTNNQFKCSIDGNIMSTVSGKVIPSYIGVCGEELFVDLPIHLVGNAWTSKSVKLGVVISIVYKNYNLPLSLWEEVELYYFDGDYLNVHPSNIAHKQYNHKFTEYFAGDDESYKIIPNYTRYAISKSGTVRRRFDGYICSTSLLDGGYVSVNLRPDMQSRSNGRRHRLLCLAYKDYPKEVDTLDVNHEDGIPGSDNLVNLAWECRTGNNLHAVRTGLNKQAMSIVAYNVITNTVMKFAAKNDAARQFGLNVGSVWSSMKLNGLHTVSKPCHLFVMECEVPEVWESPKFNQRRFELNSSVLVFDTTRDVKPKLFGSGSSAAKFIADSSPELGFKNIKATLNIKFDYGKNKYIGKWLTRRVIIVPNEVSVIRGD